jgi:hypothetical protein
VGITFNNDFTKLFILNREGKTVFVYSCKWKILYFVNEGFLYFVNEEFLYFVNEEFLYFVDEGFLYFENMNDIDKSHFLFPIKEPFRQNNKQRI